MSSLTKEKMFASALWATGGRLFSMVANFVATLILARALSPADYGLYFVGVTTVLILAEIGTLGMEQLVVRFSGEAIALKSPSALRQVVWLCVRVVIAGALLNALAFAVWGPRAFVSVLHMPGLTTCLGTVTLWLFFATLQRQLAETFRGLNDIRWTVMVGGVRNAGVLNGVLTCAGMIVLYLIGRLNLYTALMTMLVASMGLVALSITVLWRRLGSGIQGQPRHEPILQVGRALHEGWPLGLSAFIVMLNMQGSTWLAGSLDSADHVALFGASQRLLLVLVAPMTVINAILPPIVAELSAAGQMKRLERVVKSMGGMVLIPSMILLAVLIVGGRPILGLVFKPYYEAAYPILILLCIGQTINIATGSWQIVLPMTGKKNQMLITSSIAVVSQFALGLGLGSRMGVLGVAIGYCVSMTMTNIAGMLLVRRKLGIWTYASLQWQMVVDAFGMLGGRMSRKLAVQKP